MWVQKMSLKLLQLTLLLEILIVAAAIGTGMALEDWRRVPAAQVLSSAHSTRAVEGLLLHYGFFSGSYFGMMIPLTFVAFTQRKQIALGSISYKAHWLAIFLLPVMAPSLGEWFGIRPW
jgi:hypothetical protein